MNDQNENRIINFKQQGLGLVKDNIVRLVPHNEKWKEIFTEESNLILKTLDIPTLKLFHCGSTAISGIVAKPILDIVGSIDDLDKLDAKRSLLEGIGYIYKGEYGIPGRRFSTLYNQGESIGYCHMHIFLEGSQKFIEHVRFKDYLNKNNKAAKEYESVKKYLDLPRDQYSKGKAEVIAKLTEEANQFFS